MVHNVPPHEPRQQIEFAANADAAQHGDGLAAVELGD
jgi:hypothetical protein